MSTNLSRRFLRKNGTDATGHFVPDRSSFICFRACAGHSALIKAGQLAGAERERKHSKEPREIECGLVSLIRHIGLWEFDTRQIL
jgi:hypothetical protein